ncbi:MAG: hypothetical protein ACTSP6_12480 [Promethearchaeota archaeon]
MAKKKKKKKSSKSSKKEKPEISLDTALKSAKETSVTETVAPILPPSEDTQNDLQGLLKGVSEGKGFYHREVKEEERIDPQLKVDDKKKIAETYVMERVPISERQTSNKRTPLIDPQKSENETDTIPIPAPPAEVKIPDSENIYSLLEVFFEEYLKGYNERYNQWENSISNILAILRKMRKITKVNSETLALRITTMFTKIQTNLEQFKLKRDEIEKIAGINLYAMSSNVE